MDKRLLQSLGIELGLKRWEAWTLFIGTSIVGAGLIWIAVVFFLVFG